MAISNLSPQYISSSFQYLMQVSSSGEVFSGAGTQVTSLDVNATYATTAGSAAAVTGINTGSLATTGSNTFTGNQEIQGNLIVSGDLTANQYIVNSTVYAVTQSFSSGSTIFGNDSVDTHQFTGSLSVLGNAVATSFTGSILGTATNAAALNNQAASYYTNASNINAGTIGDAYLPATISSDITGNAATATSASYADTASLATNAQQVTSVYTFGTDANITYYPAFVASSFSSYKLLNVDSGGQFSYNPSTNTLTVPNIEGTSSFAQTASYVSPTFISASAAASGFGTGGGGGGTTTNSLTITNSGGTSPGTTFNGSSAITIDYSTVGAPKTDGTGASGTWGIDITGNASSATNATNATSADNATNATNATSASYAVTASYALNGGGGGSSIAVSDEGVLKTSTATSFNFVGNAVVANASGGAVTVTIATGSAGGATSPGGSTNQVQYNNAGSFAGTSGLTVSSTAVASLTSRQSAPEDTYMTISHVDEFVGQTITVASASTRMYLVNGHLIHLDNLTSASPGSFIGAGGGAWQTATSATDYSTGSLVLCPNPVSSGEDDCYLPNSYVAVNLTYQQSAAGPWATIPVDPSVIGSPLYLNTSGRVVTTPTSTSGEHVRVIGYIYNIWNDSGTGDDYLSFYFMPAGSWVTI